MKSFTGIARNFRFMLVQVKKQLESARKLLSSPDPKWIKSIRSSEGYIDTQKSMIEGECFAFIRRAPDQDDATFAAVRAVHAIAGNLERIGDFTVNITRQIEHLSSPSAVRLIDGAAYVNAALQAIDLIEPALFERDSAMALRICEVEDQLDRLYAADIARIIAALRETQNAPDLVTGLFLAHYLERMGDAILNIGEAILFAILGERLKVHEYRMLDSALTANRVLDKPLADADIASIWGTRSGVRIGSVDAGGDADAGRRVLFKEGSPEKLQRERESLVRWEAVAPGLVPAVVEYQRQGEGAALLLQYLDGRTLQEFAINNDRAAVQRVLVRLEGTLRRIWTATRRPEPVEAGFLRQIQERIDDVYRLHPEFRGGAVQLGTLRVPALAELLETAMPIESDLRAPFAVFIHGDFNLDNIIYNIERDSIHFVDVQRSRDMDYVQDVSVFLVSAFRLPTASAPQRQTLELLSLGFLRFARQFAGEQNDATFEARLALGLVRSFVTSMRFELTREFARSMLDRAQLLLSRLLAHLGRDWPAFRVPDSILIH